MGNFFVWAIVRAYTDNLKPILRRAKELIGKGQKLFGTPALLYFLENDINAANFASDELAIEKFAEMDDADIIKRTVLAIQRLTRRPAQQTYYEIGRASCRERV